ncbi:MAG: GNAT family N-acyltransferase [Campylobacterota bacterium]|nr:GNAT family N-acyltransferase [Campylobacterota bacterium]
MIDIQKEIINKYPSLSKRSPMLKKSLFKVAQKLIHEDKINDFLDLHAHLKGFEFVEAVLDYFKLDFSYSNNNILNIPSTGRVVIIANHPLGALDALCLLKLISIVRKDIKIIANDFLADVKSLDALFIKIDNFKTSQSKQSIQRVYDSLNNEEAVIIFPAGEVSRVSPYGIRDGKWQKGFLKFAQKSNSPILPILVDAKNSKTFYTVSVLNKTFSTVLLSDEMFKQHNKNINIKIGKLIAHKDIYPKDVDKKTLPNMYKKHLYNLKKDKKSLFQTQNAIANSENKQLIKKELKQSKLLGKTSDGKMIYLYTYEADSTVLKEIGRLREISFRQVNEGVNKKRDTDKYDHYYEHIVLWDEDDLEIVGSYRIGNAKEILKQHGFDGFYTHTLFEFQEDFKPYLENSIELGRSFVQPKYWGSRALDYLWFGIGAYLKENPQIRYMYGPVSLSASFSPIAKDLIVHYYSAYFKPKTKLVKAKKRYKFHYENNILKDITSSHNSKNDLKILKSSLKNIDTSIPTLYKQYAELCTEDGLSFHGFNIDPNFSDCVDGFILVDVDKIKDSKKKRYMS